MDLNVQLARDITENGLKILKEVSQATVKFAESDMTSSFDLENIAAMSSLAGAHFAASMAITNLILTEPCA